MADKKKALGWLGLGTARKAGEALAGRDKQLQQQLSEAVEVKPKRKKLSESLGIRTE